MTNGIDDEYNNINFFIIYFSMFSSSSIFRYQRIKQININQVYLNIPSRYEISGIQIAYNLIMKNMMSIYFCSVSLYQRWQIYNNNRHHHKFTCFLIFIFLSHTIWSINALIIDLRLLLLLVQYNNL